MCDSCRCPSHACEDSLSKIAQSPAKARDCAKKVRQGRQAPEEAFPRSKKAPDNRSHLIPLPLQSSQPALSRPHHSTNSIAAATSDRQPPPRSRAAATSGSMHRIRHAGHSQPHLHALARPLRILAFAAGHPKEQKEPARSGLSERSVRHVSLTCTATRACGRSRSAGEARGCGGRRHRSR